ncbi:hypothetical protein NDU88_004085 [Pleurodeles waltl]|uniref:Uncharacterized protein n=1 Tax=Pleurodeles waltl TaxID=8319 RepID=A0AAV7V3P5_PLEWA|nr:hypothetical protein NDU88_004085 [Pleurodeles waltl]
MTAACQAHRRRARTNDAIDWLRGALGAGLAVRGCRLVAAGWRSKFGFKTIDIRSSGEIEKQADFGRFVHLWWF